MTRQQPFMRQTAYVDLAEQRRPISTPPYFSVVICTYNRRDLLLATLASMRRQTLPYEQFELIIIDNGSTDDTFRALQAYINAEDLARRRTDDIWRIKCLQEEQNGLGYARNAGLQLAVGKIAVFLDDDTLVDPQFLERLLIAYEETQADAIGGCVEIRWEAPRPHWLSDDLLDLLGYFVPFRTRVALPEELSFSGCSFSVKTEALLHVGSFIPFLSKRLKAPMNMNMEVVNLCQRLRQAGYSLWYEPNAVVVHRVSQPRLQKAFLVGRAYWLGRSEILTEYSDVEQYALIEARSLQKTLQIVLPELWKIMQLACIHRPLLILAHQTMNERMQAALAQAHLWGRVQQQLQLLNHVPPLPGVPGILLVHSHENETKPLERALKTQGVHYSASTCTIPLDWLWRHRANQGQTIGIVHIYRPGAFALSHQARLQFVWRLWLAHHLGLYIVTTDAGGWWHNVRNLKFRIRRAFEHTLLTYSHLILAYTRHPERLYPEKRLRRRVHSQYHPGMRGTLTEPLARIQAYTALGLPATTDFVYLCLTNLHTEREIIHLIEAFAEMRSGLQHNAETAMLQVQLLLIGLPRDKKQTPRILKRAALNSAIHLCMEQQPEDLPLYIGATDALVMPHFAHNAAGILDMAMLFYSYGRIVIAPDLPRLHGMLPPHACLLYNPASQTALAKTLHAALDHTYHHSETERRAVDATQSWNEYAHRLRTIYQQLQRSRQ